MKRYDLHGDAYMKACPEGRYVEFDDLAALVAAAEPFVAFCNAFDGKQRGLASKPDDAVYEFNEVPITLGHLRAIRTALAAVVASGTTTGGGGE